MVKLRKLCEAYLAQHFWLAYNTKETTQRSFGYFVLACGNITVDRVKFNHGELYRGWLLKSGRTKTTTNIYTRTLSPVFNWAVKMDLISENPMKGLGQIRVTRNSVRIYSNYEFDRMMRYAPDLWQGRFLAARDHGLRRGEILNLTMDNIRSGFIYVEAKKKTDRTWPWEPKKNKVRTVPLTSQMQHWLTGSDNFYPFLTKRQSDLILKRQRAEVLTEPMQNCPDQNFRRGFVSIQRKAFGRQTGTFHDLRKTYITDMLEVLPPQFVCELVGHTNVETLMTHYAGSKGSYVDLARERASQRTKMGCNPEIDTPKINTEAA